MRHAFTKSFLLVVAVLVVAEIAVRVFWSRGLSGRFDYGYHPTAGFVEKSDGSLDLVRAGGRRFFPQHYAQQRPPGTFRIMVVGDSVPRGPSLAESYSTRVAELLQQRGIKAECWNLAVPGYGSHRCHVVLAQALKYQPSLVIRHVNNSNEYEDERELRRSEDFQGWHPKNLLMKSLLVRRLYEMTTEGLFWSLLPEKIRAQQGVNDAAAKIIAMADAEKIHAWQERVRRYLKEDLDLCRKAGVPVLLVTQARLRGGGPSATLDDSGLDALARSLVSPEVAMLSMKESLSGMDFAPLFMDNAHLHAPGHLVLAKAIVEKLAGFLPPR
ncbi:MAG: SGNH/GDSL hydrolase family protein [Chthoniobacteraceae bacterium]